MTYPPDPNHPEQGVPGRNSEPPSAYPPPQPPPLDVPYVPGPDDTPVPPPPPGPPVKKKGMSTAAIIAIVVGILVALCCVGGVALAAIGSRLPAPKPTPATVHVVPATTAAVVPSSAPATSAVPSPVVTTQAAPPPPPPPPPTPAGPATSFGDGVWLVGSDIAPGQYRARVPEGSHCYWEREKDTNGTFSSIIANGNADGGTQAVVTIGRSDAAFKSDGCGTWTKIG
jgi:hypothetical protein